MVDTRQQPRFESRASTLQQLVRRSNAMPAFRARIKKIGLLYAVDVPPAVFRALGPERKIPVIVRYLGDAHPSTATSDRAGCGRLFLRVEVFRPHRLGAGDDVDITIARDRSPQVVVLPPDLAQALRFRPAAAAAFTRGSPSTRRMIVALLEESRKPETRQRRLEKIIERLAENTADRATKV